MGSTLNILHGIHHDLPDGNKLRAAPSLHEIKHPFLGILQNRIQALFSDIAVVGDLFIQTDQPSQHRLFTHNARIVLYIRGGRHRHNQISDKLGAAHFRRYILLPQPVL